MRRSSALLGVLVVAMHLGVPQALAAPAQFEPLELMADLDDDDVNGEPDGASRTLHPRAWSDLIALDRRLVGASLLACEGAHLARIVANGTPLPWGSRIPSGAALQGLGPGRMLLTARWPTGEETTLTVNVHALEFRDGENRALRLSSDAASLARTPPTRLGSEPGHERFDDPDALRIVLTSPPGSELSGATIASLDPRGVVLDELREPSFVRVPCGDAVDATLSCTASLPLRFVFDDVDRLHPLVRDRSLRAEVGGAIALLDGRGRKLQALRVAGPRQSSVGPLGRSRLTIRPFVMRVSSKGGPAIGTSDAGAVAALRQELLAAAATWGQCGLTFGPAETLDVTLANPPAPYLVAIGDDLGLPASGGVLTLSVDGKKLTHRISAGWSAYQVAMSLKEALEKRGFDARVSENARIFAGAASSVDVAVRRRSGGFATVSLVSSTDATLVVRIGGVDLSDGLQHFGDTDSVAGTLEERALVKSLDDGDPRTVEVLVVPFFSGGGRIGESFIASDASSVRNVVIVDRVGIRSRRTTQTLAHELGHVLLDDPGHPDDYGEDTPTLLMDSDAADASAFGPRRLRSEDCARVLRQSGPSARVPLLSEWKLEPLPYPKTTWGSSAHR